MTGQNTVERIHAQILADLPVEVRLGRVLAPEVRAPEAVVDPSGDLIPSDETEGQRKRRFLRRRFGLDRQPLVQGSIAAHIVQGQRALPLKDRAIARLRDLGRRPAVLLAVGLAIGAVGVGAALRTSTPKDGDLALASPQARAVNVEAEAQDAFGAPKPRDEAQVIVPAAASPDQSPVPTHVISSLKDVSALPAPVADQAVAIPGAGATPGTARDSKGTAAADPGVKTRNDISALDEEEAAKPAAFAKPSAPPQTVAKPAQATPSPAASAPAPATAKTGVVVPQMSFLPGQQQQAIATSPKGAAKQLVTWKYGHLGIAAVTGDGVVISASQGRPQQKIAIGGRLPNGAALLAVDPAKERIETDTVSVQLQ